MPSFHIFPGLTAETSLSLSTDGPIPAAQWAEAREWDAAHPLKPASARPGRIRLKPAALAARMESIIEQAACRAGLVTRDDFRQAGFSEAEVDAHAAHAFRRAITRRPALAQLLEG